MSPGKIARVTQWMANALTGAAYRASVFEIQKKNTYVTHSDWSTPLKSLDDVMLMREPRSVSVPPVRRTTPVTSGLRRLAIDPAIEDLHSEFRYVPFHPSSTGKPFYWANASTLRSLSITC